VNPSRAGSNRFKMTPQKLASEGDIAWLTTKGKVYQLVDTD
jgi:hypothetical protein